MGISHEYHSASRRRTRGGIGGKLRLAGVIVAILLVAYAVTAILEKGTVEEDSTPQTGAGGIAQNILAPLPMQGEAASGSGSEGAADSSSTAQAVQLESFGPARQTDGAYTIKAYDASVIRQSACGQVDLSYFSDAAFLGDSLTVGFSDYQINLSGALICGYTGVGPDAIVNRAAVKSPTRGQEVALDVLAAAQPKKLYILLGTNTLTTLGASDRFLAYYGQMLDELRQTLGDDCIIYVQSIPPVRPAAAEKKPGLASDNLLRMSESVAEHVERLFGGDAVRTGDDSLGDLLGVLERLSSLYERQYPYFREDPKCRLASTARRMSIERMRDMTPEAARWMASHPHE